MLLHCLLLTDSHHSHCTVLVYLFTIIIIIIYIFFKSKEERATKRHRGLRAWSSVTLNVPVPEDTQGQAGWSSEQPDVAVGAPVHYRRVGVDGL